MKSQIAPQEADVNQRKAAWDLRRKQLDDLKVKAGMDRSAAVVVIRANSSAARRSARAPTSRASPTRNLKAELRIAETQTKDIRIGQYAEVDTRNGVVKGHVSRMDPASAGGTVGVDVIMDGRCPRARGPT